MTERSLSSTALVFAAGVFLFVSPFAGWWTALGLPWYAIFVPWALVIALIALEEHGGHRRPPDADAAGDDPIDRAPRPGRRR